MYVSALQDTLAPGTSALCSFLQAVMIEHVVVYQGNSEKEVDRFDPGVFEATLWREVVIDSARGRLLRSDGVRLTRDSTKLAQGVYRFYAAEAGEARAKPAQVWAVSCDLQLLDGQGELADLRRLEQAPAVSISMP